MEQNAEQITLLPPHVWPKRLHEIPQPPAALWIRGTLPNTRAVWLTVVGSRRASDYGLRACKTLIAALHGYPVVIVSGLALGIDACAHEAALAAELPCVAVPGSGLHTSVLAPAAHWQLAEKIITAGGCVLSPFPPTRPAAPYTFPTRNRIMVGLSHAVLVIEAAEKSGTLITARMAADYNRDLGVVPGSIFATQSAGPHQFLSLGATPIYSAQSLLAFLGFDDVAGTLHTERTTHTATPTLSDAETHVLKALEHTTSMHALAVQVPLSAHELATTLTLLELRGIITITGSTISRT